jgi:L-threonylcarbamoyladenylate synthase
MDINTEVHQAFEVIKNGGIILYPTDTVWGLGCDATNETAVNRLFELKKRTQDHSMIVLVNGDRLIHRIFKEVPETAWQILELSEKPTTLVLDDPKNVAPQLVAKDNSLGIRVVKDPFCYKLIERMKNPLVSTSANFSGAPTPTCFVEITTDLINQVDYVVNLDRDKKTTKSSAIIKLTRDAQVKIIRS